MVTVIRRFQLKVTTTEDPSKYGVVLADETVSPGALVDYRD